jgi:hypothetical protein
MRNLLGLLICTGYIFATSNNQTAPEENHQTTQIRRQHSKLCAITECLFELNINAVKASSGTLSNNERKKLDDESQKIFSPMPTELTRTPFPRHPIVSLADALAASNFYKKEYDKYFQEMLSMATP